MKATRKRRIFALLFTYVITALIVFSGDPGRIPITSVDATTNWGYTFNNVSANISGIASVMSGILDLIISVVPIMIMVVVIGFIMGLIGSVLMAMSGKIRGM